MQESNDGFTIKELLTQVMREVNDTHNSLVRHMAREESQLENILLEQKKTNGRVRVLEDSYHQLAVKHETITVKLGLIVTAVSIIVTGVVSTILNKLM